MLLLTGSLRHPCGATPPSRREALDTGKILGLSERRRKLKFLPLTGSLRHPCRASPPSRREALDTGTI